MSAPLEHAVHLKKDRTVLQNKAGNAHESVGFYGIKGWIAVPKAQERFQVTYVPANVNELKIRIVCQRRLYLRTIGTGVHYKYFYHLIVI